VANDRSRVTRELFKLEWDYPVWHEPDAPKSEGTSVKALRHALPRDEALRFLAGKDPRPLLVLRECAVCNKTDDALLSRDSDNEKTLILARWFHCVKLPVDVVQPDHPFNALFPNNDAEHLFVSAVDGSSKLPLESDTSRRELWASMTQVLGDAYMLDPNAAYKEVVRRLDRVSSLTEHVEQLGLRKSELMEKPKVDPDVVRKVAAEITDVQKQLDGERAEIAKLSKLELKTGDAKNAAPAKAAR
jgi:hypothetical protein